MAKKALQKHLFACHTHTHTHTVTVSGTKGLLAVMFLTIRFFIRFRIRFRI